MSQEEFEEKVLWAQEQIAAGEVFQLVLSVCFSGSTSIDPFTAYRALRLLNPSPYMYFLDLGDAQIVGSSPEALVRLQNGTASLRPIAGTRPRDDDPEKDVALEMSLRDDPKENAEHVMLVDLARNDLGRVAVPGTIKVEPYRSIERYSHVMHLVSGVQGQVEEEFDAFDLFAAAFPAGTLVGAPKVRAMELIEEAEPVRRDFYAGTVGYFDHEGNLDQAIAIRTMVFHQGRYRFQAGAGIVADSVPRLEYEEVLHKSNIFAPGARHGEGRTMSAHLLMIDNYDSFTFNLVQGFRGLGATVEVHRNDQISLQDAIHAPKTHLVISPGPGNPDSAGISVELIQALAGVVPILGVCLGHQSIVAAYGGTISRAPRQMHGKTSDVEHDGKGVFKDIDTPFVAGRYHSLTATDDKLPETARGDVAYGRQ